MRLGRHGWDSKAGGEKAKPIKKVVEEEIKSRGDSICHYYVSPPSFSSFFSLPLFCARAPGLQFDPQLLPAIVAPDTLHSSPFLLAFQIKLPGPALFVVKNEQLRVGMFPRREVKGSVWTSGHLQCLTCRHVMWKAG